MKNLGWSYTFPNNIPVDLKDLQNDCKQTHLTLVLRAG